MAETVKLPTGTTRTLPWIGRPSEYSLKTGLAIARLLAEGVTLREICRLAALTPNEAAFCTEYLAGGSAIAAAEAAGYADARTAAHRLRRRDKVQRAIRALIRARDAESRVGHERACEIVETAISTRLDDFGVTTSTGVLVDLKDPATLSDGQLARVRRMEAKVHRSAKGERGGYAWIRIELVPVTELIAQLGKLRGWTPDAPAFQVLLQQPAAKNPGLELLHEAAADLLEGLELDEYLRAHLAGDTATQVRLLRESAQRLRRVRDAITAELVE